jgi:hypothetical protein
MIVQSAPEGQPRFVIEQIDHARMSGQLAEALGNARFAGLDPREPMEYVAGHHDEGWAQVDAQAKRDPNTGLPYHLTQTPLADLIFTGPRSPDFNERHHPLSGLISSMHTWGLYHGRYGLSDFLFIDRITPELRPQVDGMLKAELARQERLKQQLSHDPATARHTDEVRIVINYKLLQFFDTLSLYFHTTHAEARKEGQFKNVPRAAGEEVTVNIKPVGANRYRLEPYPFADDGLTVWVEGRYLTPQPGGADFAEMMRAMPKVRQEFVLVS